MKQEIIHYANNILYFIEKMPCFYFFYFYLFIFFFGVSFPQKSSENLAALQWKTETQVVAALWDQKSGQPEAMGMELHIYHGCCEHVKLHNISQLDYDGCIKVSNNTWLPICMNEAQ